VILNLIMKPESYFPDLYLEDLESYFGKDSEHVSNGMLCGAVLSDFQSRNIKLIGYEEFFCCQYVLNLIHQGVYCYRDSGDACLLNTLIPFLDIGRCSMRHGGMVRPRDILRHVKVPQTMLSDFVKYYFYVYLPNLNVTEDDISNLLSHLRNDPDCEEINQLL